MGENDVITCIIQARTGSSRLPNKVVAEIDGMPLIVLMLERLRKSAAVEKFVVATTSSHEDTDLHDLLSSRGFHVYRGAKEDVLDRYYRAALIHNSSIVIRITGDCPFIDPSLVDNVVEKLISDKLDYVCNRTPATFPDGLDVEAFTFEALARAHSTAFDVYDREHVTPIIYRSGDYLTGHVSCPVDYSEYRLTVDEPEDLDAVRKIADKLTDVVGASWMDVIKIVQDNSDIYKLNSNFNRNEGALMSSGQKLWRRAKRTIAGGNMILSKRPDMFLPNQWPTYFSKAKGCEVWDLDGNRFVDMSLMGVGTNVLGYGHVEVDEAVAKAVSDGNLSTLNCPEEVYLAETLVEMHPWASKVKFARSGGEANAVAVRIARAYTGKDRVAVCGYHGWHDWYLAVNLNGTEELTEHLLPGLEANGVPKSLGDSSFAFSYNDIDSLKALLANHDISVIKMEVSRNYRPKDNFLKEVRALATDNNIILIYDECTSGFRETFGGLHLKYDVEPDIAVFGKTLGNGYAITAIMGRDMVMDAAQSTFISSTFWSERIGPVAALKTLEVMKREKSWEYITNMGDYAVRELTAFNSEFNFKIEVSGLPSMLTYKIDHPDWNKYKTYITQEMLKKGYLATNAIYSSTQHTVSIVDQFMGHLRPVLQQIELAIEKGDIDSKLEGPEANVGFKRLN
jgi:glutamate-1-semialdehyde 2,1-aminomutase